MEKLKQFYLLVQDVWENGLFGIDIGHFVVAVFIFFAFLLLRRLFARFIIGRIKIVTKRTKTVIDDDMLAALEKPVQFIPVVLGVYFAAEYLPIYGGIEIIANKFVRSLIVFVMFWGLVNLLSPMAFLLRRLEKVFTSSMVDWLLKAIKATFIFIGAATILEIWGIKVGPILAGLGLFGVAVALGAQDLFKNLISGILVIAEKRFNIGDWIRVEGVVEGTVESIGFRSTLVRRFDKAPVFVPNSKLSDHAVINFSSMTHRRIYWNIGVEYRTTVRQLRQIRDSIEQYILESEYFAKPPQVSMFVRIDRFSDSSIDIMVYCFTKTTDWGNWLEIKETLAYRIKEIVEEAGSAFAFPSQSLYIETLPTEAPEIFVPPST
ncbi:MAG: mechanosensitive ion channel protein MscS [Desulfobacteraceae bacterium 4572_123]|nr:MAG: mechanosensitive ion channel protein MscS [Desulfobacteraceae bacterium 4572_123]